MPTAMRRALTHHSNSFKALKNVFAERFGGSFRRRKLTKNCILSFLNSQILTSYCKIFKLSHVFSLFYFFSLGKKWPICFQLVGSLDLWNCGNFFQILLIQVPAEIKIVWQCHLSGMPFPNQQQMHLILRDC